MLPNYMQLLFICALSVIFVRYCDGQFINFKIYDTSTTATPYLPFPPCPADNIDCLGRGIRTFFFLMDSGYLGMTSVDPIVLNSLTVALPEEQLSFLIRKINVTGARWTRLVERKFNLPGGKNGVRFKSDLHITGEITMMMETKVEPYIAQITMDIHAVETNVTYTWTGQRGIDNEDYILVGPERLIVRNSRTPTFFLQSRNMEDGFMIEQILNSKRTLLEHISNEITIALMSSVVDNFRLFASKVPAKHFYTLADNYISN